MKRLFKLSLLVLLFCLISPAFSAPEKTRAIKPLDGKFESELEERLWNAKRTLEAGNLEVAEQLYRLILRRWKDEPHALLGLARVFHKIAKRDGVYPAGMEELMGKMQRIIDKQGEGVADMRLRVGSDPRALTPTVGRDNYVPADAKNWNFSNRDSARDRSRHWQAGSDGKFEKSACQNLEEVYSRNYRDYLPEITPALLFRGDCPEPEFKHWYFLDPPS